MVILFNYLQVKWDIWDFLNRNSSGMLLDYENREIRWYGRTIVSFGGSMDYAAEYTPAE